MKNSIYRSETIYNYFMKLNLCRVFSHVAIKHMPTIIVTTLSVGYKGKTVDFERYSSCHRTTLAHFLNNGVWDDNQLRSIIKSVVIGIIYSEPQCSGKPVYCFVDDTISSKTKSSSQAMHPIEDAYFHFSHLKRRQDYGHQAIAIMFSCNGITLNYDIIMYDKSKSKVQIVQDTAKVQTYH